MYYFLINFTIKDIIIYLNQLWLTLFLKKKTEINGVK